MSKPPSNKSRKNHPKSMENRSGSLPQRLSKNKSQNDINKIGEVPILASNLVSRRGVDEGTFWICFTPGTPLGARMAPRPLPRGSGTPPDLNFQWNLIEFPRFSYDFGWCLSDFLHAGESFHILLRLSAVNLENCLQGKVLDNTFDIFKFCSMELGWNRKLST